jgi:uncharacterized protein YukE
MARIVVRPEDLRSLASRLDQSAQALDALAGRIGAAWGGLDWEARQKSGLEGPVSQARSRANACAREAEALARFLKQKAERFEEADAAGSQGLNQIAHAIAPLLRNWEAWMRRVKAMPHTMEQRLKELLGLGSLARYTPLVLGTATAGLLGGLLAGVTTLLPGSAFWKDRFDGQNALSSSQARLAGAAGSRAPLGVAPVKPYQLPEVLPACPVPPPVLRPATPSTGGSCALYAQARRPDLGPCGGNHGAYNYIEKYANTPQSYRVDETMASGDLGNTWLRPGTAVVWDRTHPKADPTYGHVAIIEEVGPDYVVVSESGWSSGTRRQIPASELPALYFIL